MDEWWFVAKDEIEWKIGKDEPFVAKRVDIVFVESGRPHAIRTVGEKSSIRYAVTTSGGIHYFLDNPGHPRPPKD
jgi:mannose-6-phosphate isomerase-like protein (cupin superfamily)